MAKNFFKTIFNSNKDKNNISKNQKLSPTYKLSDLVINTKTTDDSKILQQQQQTFDSYNTLLNYYTKNDDNNNIINRFLEKISKLNNKFYTSSKEFIITKTSFDKLSDELFLNLFKQIDCYVEEIQRLNKKISSLDNKDNKLIIKNLSKELTEKKEKLRNCEIKLREKTTKEEKLLKEIESYKRRIIFFKNKININLMFRNRYQRVSSIRIKRENYNNNNNIFTKKFSKNYDKCSSKGSILKKDKNLRDFFSPSPGKSRGISNGLGYLSSKNSHRLAFRASMHQVRRKIDSNIINSNIDTLGNNTTIHNYSISLRTISGLKNESQNAESGNIDTKSKGFFSNGEAEDINKRIIKIHRSKKTKENLMLPFNKNYNKDDDNLETICVEKNNDENNFDKDIDKNININENKKENDLNSKDNFELKIYSPEIKPKPFENNFTELNLLQSDKEENDPKKKEDNKDYKSSKKIVNKFSLDSSTLDLKNKSNKKKNEIVVNPKNMKWKTNTTKKSSGIKKIFNYPSKKFLIPSPKTSNKFNTNNNTGKNSLNNSYNNTANQFYSNKNINNSLNNDVSNKYNTIDNNSNNNYGKNNPIKKLSKSNTIGSEINNKDEILEYKASKSKTVRFKQDDIKEKEQKYQFTASESENCEISSKELPIFVKAKKTLSKSDYNKINKAFSGNNSDIISKGTINNENSSCGDNNSLILKKEKKIGYNKKTLLSSQSFRNNSKRKNTNKSSKDIALNLKNKQKEKELGKILKEMNGDYNNEIEMLNRQEEQIEYMLKLIESSDS